MFLPNFEQIYLFIILFWSSYVAWPPKFITAVTVVNTDTIFFSNFWSGPLHNFQWPPFCHSHQRWLLSSGRHIRYHKQSAHFSLRTCAQTRTSSSVHAFFSTTLLIYLLYAVPTPIWRWDKGKSRAIPLLLLLCAFIACSMVSLAYLTTCSKVLR